MKDTLLVIVVLLVGGCGKKQSTNTNESNNTPAKPTKKKVEKGTPSKGDDNDSTEIKPVKELMLREKVVGEYEHKKGGDTERLVLPENGIWEIYLNGEKTDEGKWRISEEGEIHVEDGNDNIGVLSINKDDSITLFAFILKDGKRLDPPNEDRSTYKKIK